MSREEELAPGEMLKKNKTKFAIKTQRIRKIKEKREKLWLRLRDENGIVCYCPEYAYFLIISCLHKQKTPYTISTQCFNIKQHSIIQYTRAARAARHIKQIFSKWKENNRMTTFQLKRFVFCCYIVLLLSTYVPTPHSDTSPSPAAAIQTP